jgi:hypothetical protein
MNLQSIAIIAAAVIFFGMLGGFYLKGRSDCAAAVQVKAYKTEIIAKEKNNEIRNKRPDDIRFADRLRAGHL